MPGCPRHPKFNVAAGVYYRAADPANPADWVPKNDAARAKFYKIAAGGDEQQMAELMGEAQMIHSGESSAGSGFVSVASCPVCLAETGDPTVTAILQSRRYLCRLVIKTRNQPGAPYIFHMEGEGVGASETEALVLLQNGGSLLNYHDGYVTLAYIESMR